MIANHAFLLQNIKIKLSGKDRKMENNNEPSKSKKGFLLTGASLISLIVVPLLLAIPLFFGLLTCPEFYTSILRNADLIETFVDASNWQVEKKIRRQIETSVHLEEFRIKYDTIKGLYEKKKENYDALNRTEEYEKIKKQREELSDLSYENAPDRFKIETEFETYKEGELNRLDSLMDEIKLFRDVNKDAIKAAEEEMEGAEEAYDDAKDILEQKMDEANDIIKEQKDSLSGEIYGDLNIISPVLTRDLNEKLIDTRVKAVIEEYISFFCSYYKQKELGNIYTDRMDTYLQGLSEPVKVRLPEIDISLYVEDEVNGVLQKRHIAGDIFIDRIMNIPGLKKREMFVKIFKFTESGLAEMIGDSYLKDYDFKISDGVIKSGPIILTGGTAAAVEFMMMAATLGKYLIYILPAAALIILFLIFRSKSEKSLGYVHIRRILILPSLAALIISLSAVLLSGFLTDIFPDLVSGPLLQSYCKTAFRVIAVHIFVPVAALFAVCLIAGFFIRKGKAGAE